MNRICIVGRLGGDPELTYTAKGDALAKMSVAVNRDFKNAAGEREADWFYVTAWRQTAEFCANYLAKGRLVSVAGRMQRRDYTADDGSKRTAWELVADSVNGLDKPKEDAGAAATPHDEGDPFSDE